MVCRISRQSRLVRGGSRPARALSPPPNTSPKLHARCSNFTRRYVADYVKLYVDTLRPAVAAGWVVRDGLHEAKGAFGPVRMMWCVC